MKRHELVEILNEIAQEDIEAGSDIYDHPCSVAVRALAQAVEDIDSLRKVASSQGKSERIHMLINTKYDPSY